MENPPHPMPPQEGNYQAGAGLFVGKLPDELGVPLRSDDFKTLCEGGTAESRASRDLCIGLLGGAVLGICGILATEDSDFVWKPEHRGWFLFWVILMIVIAAGSAAGAVIYGARAQKIATDSPYARLVAKMRKLYEEGA